jgi:kumamolisin
MRFESSSLELVFRAAPKRAIWNGNTVSMVPDSVSLKFSPKFHSTICRLRHSPHRSALNYSVICVTEGFSLEYRCRWAYVEQRTMCPGLAAAARRHLDGLEDHVPTSRIVLPGSYRNPVKDGERIGPANPSEQTYVTVIVRRKSEPVPITAFGTNADRQRYISDHGANASDLLSVVEFAKEHNLKCRNEDAATRSVELHGTLSDLSRAFEVGLEGVRIHGKNYRVRRGDLTVPEEIAGKVQAVLGLDNRPAAKPLCRRRHPNNFHGPSVTAALSPLEVAELYGFPLHLDGSGQSIAIIELGGGFLRSDLATYFRGLHLPIPSVGVVLLDGQSNTIGRHLPAHPELNADDQVALDLQIAGAISPGAVQTVYFTRNTDQSFLKAVNAAIYSKPKPVVICIGWGTPESECTDQFKISFEQSLQDAANFGIPVCIASGCSESLDNSGELIVDFPSSAPHALGCGGTTLSGPGNKVAVETPWNSSVDRAAAHSPRSATGRGVSLFFNRPIYQASVNTSPSSGAGERRAVPDVCANADPSTGYRIRVEDSAVIIGGTSCAAALWAGLIARFGQSLKTPVGFLNPQLYQTDGAGFRSIVPSNNDGPGTDTARQTAQAWNPDTGLGSPNGGVLLQSLRSTRSASELHATHAPDKASPPKKDRGALPPPLASKPSRPALSSAIVVSRAPTMHLTARQPHPGTCSAPQQFLVTRPPASVSNASPADLRPNFPPLPIPDPPPPLVLRSHAVCSPGNQSSNAVAVVSILGLAAMLGMVTAASLLATVGISREIRPPV